MSRGSGLRWIGRLLIAACNHTKGVSAIEVCTLMHADCRVTDASSVLDAIVIATKKALAYVRVWPAQTSVRATK